MPRRTPSTPDGPIADKIHNLFMPVIAVAGVVFVLVQGLIIVTVVRHRHRPGRPDPIQVHGNTKLEFGWTVVPALLLVGDRLPDRVHDLRHRPGTQGRRAAGRGVRAHVVVGVPLPDARGSRTANELHIPTGRPIRLTLHTIEPGLPAAEGEEFAQGVIHSFWVPKLAGKQDVVPGRVNKLTIQAEKPGTYLGQCAEYCNLSHANMRLRVIAQTPQDFEAWVAEQQKPAESRPAATPPRASSSSPARAAASPATPSKGIEGAVARVGPEPDPPHGPDDVRRRHLRHHAGRT